MTRTKDEESVSSRQLEPGSQRVAYRLVVGSNNLQIFCTESVVVVFGACLRACLRACVRACVCACVCVCLTRTIQV